MTGKLKNEQFLRNYGGVEINDLTNILNCESEIDDNTFTIIQVSNYHDLDDLLNKQIFLKKNQFKKISFNSESLFSKLDEIKIFLEILNSNNIYFDAIALMNVGLSLLGRI